MDAAIFDNVTRACGDAWSRRCLTQAILGLALGGAAGELQFEAAAKKKSCPPCKKRKKGKCRKHRPDGTACTGGTCQNGRCTAPPCCGGVCPRCPNGRTCADRNDCAGALCAGGTCQECGEDQPCVTGFVCSCQPRFPSGKACVSSTSASRGPFSACTACTVDEICVPATDPTQIICAPRCDGGF